MNEETWLLVRAAEEGDLPKIRRFFSRFKRRDPAHARYYDALRRGVEKALRGELLAALAELYEASDNGQSDVVAYNAAHHLIAWACQNHGDLLLAAESLRQVENLDEEDSFRLRQLLNLSGLNERRLDMEVGRRFVTFYRARLKRSSKDPATLGRLAWWLFTIDEEDESLKVARQALALDPANRSAVETAFDILWRRGKDSEALEILRRAEKQASSLKWIRDLFPHDGPS